ncbi:MAG TPA: SUMF1/EgtB/PvdO family nonheme iron enzyme [Pyrinomonadaceae bacterium]|nr:SUMF1/EgtB/PvdO family nonheme iron enzyme [Pyrinomonadaceae bacterium]
MMRIFVALLAACVLRPACAAQAGKPPAAVSELPRPTGPHAVGTITFRWADAGRPEIATEDPADTREVIAQVWYPAEAGADDRPAAYFPDLGVLLSALRSDAQGGGRSQRLAEQFAALDGVRTHSLEGARAASGRRRFPVLVFSPGGNMSRHFYTVLMEELASRGYVVAGLSHKHSGLDVFPSEGLVASHPRWVRPRELETREEKDRFWEPLAEAQAADASFVLDRLTELDRRDPAGRFKGRLDLRRAAVLGHSRGAKTVARALSSDRRFKAGVIFDNLPPLDRPGSGPHAPVLMLRPADWPAESLADLRAFFERRRAEGFDVAVEGAAHMSFADYPFVFPAEAAAKLERGRALRIIYDYTLAFLERHLGPARRRRARPRSDAETNWPRHRGVSVVAYGPGKDPAGMALVPGATFEMGTDPPRIARLQEVFKIGRAELFAGELPRHRVRLGPFRLDAHEVTNAQFKSFLEQNPRWLRERAPASSHNGEYLKGWRGVEHPEGKGAHPVVNVSWYAAAAFCGWAGKRLPTEAEWEWAARGGLEAPTFPWGDEPAHPSRANYGASGLGTTTAVASYPANGYGLFDMAGNVWEYLADEWGPYPSAPQVNPVAGGLHADEGTRFAVKTRRVIRGGSWGGAPVNLRVAYRDSHPPENAREFVGFRCAKQ